MLLLNDDFVMRTDASAHANSWRMLRSLWGTPKREAPRGPPISALRLSRSASHSGTLLNKKQAILMNLRDQAPGIGP